MIPQWIKDIAKGLIAFLLYSLGRRDEAQSRDAKEAKSELEWLKSTDEKREAIRTRYDYIRSRTPDNWDDVNRMREASKVQSVGKAGKTFGG
jgi:RecA-family ATPase